MTEDVTELLERLRQRMTEAQFREWLRATHESLDRAEADAAVDAHLDRVGYEHTGRMG